MYLSSSLSLCLSFSLFFVGQVITVIKCPNGNSITPPNVWHKNQDRITNFELYTHFRKCALPPLGSTAGPCEYSILDSYSNFFVLLELDSDQTLLGPSSE